VGTDSTAAKLDVSPVKFGTSGETVRNIVQIATGGYHSGVLHLAAGGYHTCAVVGPNAPGTVSCWGQNADGQVTGIRGPDVMTPTTLTRP
jgi:hypothetical protein